MKENNSKTWVGWNGYCPKCDRITYDRIDVGGGKCVRGTIYNKKKNTHECMVCGTDIGKHPLTDTEAELLQENWMREEEENIGHTPAPTMFPDAFLESE